MNTEEKLRVELNKLSLSENDVIVVKFKYGSCPVLDISEFVSAIKSMV